MSAVEALIGVQEASFAGADGALRASWPPERAMGAAELESFLEKRRFCVLATTSGRGRPQARPVAFVLFGGALWFATVTGGRLRNLERIPWVSVVISEGEGDEHRMVAADGAVTVVGEPPQALLEAWERRTGSRAEWAAAWLELRPQRLYSYSSSGA